MQEWLTGGDATAGRPATVLITCGVVFLLLLAPVVIALLARGGKLSADLQVELRRRTLSWYGLVAAIFTPILLGPWPTVVAIVVLSFFCFGEFARSTGLAHERLVCALVVFGTLAVNFAAGDDYPRLFAALAVLVSSLIAAASILRDEPHGYLRRVAFGIFGFLFFGYGFGHLSYMTNSALYRPILLMIITAVELNDVFAYIAGRIFGHRRLLPSTSPKKTLAGALAALALTSATVVGLGSLTFVGTSLGHWYRLLPLGLAISLSGQLGDLMLSSIKRDLGIKDLGRSIPGHGGFLDRFDSLVLVAPLVFYYIDFYLPFGSESALRFAAAAQPR